MSATCGVAGAGGGGVVEQPSEPVISSAASTGLDAINRRGVLGVLHVAGVDVPDKLRRNLGQGKTVSWEVIAEKMRAFDRNNDDALTREELAEWLHKSAGVGAPWFCKVIADSVWRALETNFSDPITWIKIPVLAGWTSAYMAMMPRRAKRIRITPESATGYEPLEYLDGTRVETFEMSVNASGAAVVKEVQPGSARPSGAPQPVTAQSPQGQGQFRRAPEPFTRTPQAAAAATRVQPSAAPKPPAPTTATRAPTAEAQRRPAAGPARPAAPRRPGPRK